MYEDDITPSWPGFEWANPSQSAMEEDMRDGLAEALDLDGEAVAAVLEYLADPKNGYDTSETKYTAAQLAELFNDNHAEYTDWITVGTEYLNDHYPGLIEDGLAGLDNDVIKQVGVNVGGSEHEVERHFWYEADDGRIFTIARPHHIPVKEEQA